MASDWHPTQVKLVDKWEIAKFQIQLSGAYISNTGGYKGEIKRRLEMGRSAVTKLNTIWADRGVTEATCTKIKLVQTLTFPMYVCIPANHGPSPQQTKTGEC